TGKTQQQLSLINRNTQRLLNLVNQVLNFRKLMTDHQEMKVVQSDFVHFLRELYLPFKATAQLRQINYNFTSSATAIMAWFDEDKLEKVFFNLLSNAFKFTPDGGTISVDVQEYDTVIKVTVQDSGIGVAPELREEIFKRFYEKASLSSSAIKSSGIGLAISKQMVALHHGKIFVAPPGTENGNAPSGARFVVQLPKGRDHFNENEIVTTLVNQEQPSAYEPLVADQLGLPAAVAPAERTEVTDASPLLLIVEDNVEVNTYIQQLFEGKYRLLTAANGVEGLALAKQHSPDLIISDVMMPKMDGITLCNHLKTVLETSHIPIVLLTARAASLFKIEGLRTGADDYVTKPFHPEELALRVHNIIKARHEAREKFARVVNLDPKQVTVTSADEEFLQSALKLVEDNMDNTNFTVEYFAHAMAVSRPLLFLKIKALTNQTPKNFVKRIRLKRAAQLLTQRNLRITEVAYAVGFQNPRYFSKCFFKEYDQTPTDYMTSAAGKPIK
ncbi:MAG: response regulator, partial [Bacteroidota bacterium]